MPKSAPEPPSFWHFHSHHLETRRIILFLLLPFLIMYSMCQECVLHIDLHAHTCQKHHNHKTSDKSLRAFPMLSFFFFILKLMGYFFPKTVNYFHSQSLSMFYFHKFSLFLHFSPLLSLHQAFNSWFCAMVKIISCKIRLNFRLFEHYWHTSI